MILVIDNYDSFTYNLVHYIGEFDNDIKVIRNDEMSVDDILGLKPDKIVISPGPCTPNEAGISEELIKSSSVPLLGVCLGHQAIGTAFGGKFIKAPEIVHGKSSNIIHESDDLFNNIETPYSVIRYHSLVIEMNSLPDELMVTATLENNKNMIMGLKHKERPIFGVQFHPESIDTDNGKKLIENFLNILLKKF